MNQAPPERRISLRASLRQQSRPSPTAASAADDAAESSPSPVPRSSSRRRSSSSSSALQREQSSKQREMELASPVLQAPILLQDSPSPPPSGSAGLLSPEPGAFDPAVALGSLMYQVPSPTQPPSTAAASASAAAAAAAAQTAATAQWSAALPAAGSNPGGASLFSASSASASPPAPLPLSSSFDPALLAAYQQAQQHSAQHYGYPSSFAGFLPQHPLPPPLPLGSQQLQPAQSQGQHQLSPPLLPPSDAQQQQAYYAAASQQFMPYPGQPFYPYPQQQMLPQQPQQQAAYPYLPQQPHTHPPLPMPHFPHPIAHHAPSAAAIAPVHPHPRAHAHPHPAGAAVASVAGSTHAHASTPLPILTPWLLANHRAGLGGSVLPLPEARVDLWALQQQLLEAAEGDEDGDGDGAESAMAGRASAVMAAFQSSLAAVLSNNARRGCGMLVLPRSDLAAPIEFVSAKQHERLCHRMQRRAFKRAQSAFHASGARKHHSRQLHAIRRVRGKGGRFLTKEEKEAMQMQQQVMGAAGTAGGGGGGGGLDDDGSGMVFSHELALAGLDQEELEDEED